MSDELCPPHFFLAAWASENEGVLFCRLCGDVREMKPASQTPPPEEKGEPLTAAEMEQLRRDYGEPK